MNPRNQKLTSPAYAPLRVRSCHSLLTGASAVDALLDKAARLGIASIALTDEANLYGAVPFVEAAAARGVRPILGAVISDGQGVLLARDEAGYANLCEIITAARLEENFSIAETVPARQDGLFVLTPDAALAESLAGRLDPGRLWLELIRPGADPAAQVRLRETARRLDLGLVASCDVYYADPADFDLHEVLCAMRENCRLTDVRRRGIARIGRHLRSPDEFAHLFRDVPAAVAATRRIAEACTFDLSGRPPVFPKLPGDSAAMLRARALDGARKRYGRIARDVRARLDHEYDLITRLGFADYFLVVADIVRHARALGTPVAGRGSGGSSIIAYCLGITNADPVRFNLPFERFLNEGRQDFPDLDVDFCWRLRDDVIDYVYRKYGNDHVAMIATYATLQPRLAFREVAKALGMPNQTVTEVMRKLHHGLPTEPWVTFPADPRVVDRTLAFVRRCAGFPHHLSVHCGGVVITPDRIARHVPLQRATKGVVITQYDKDGVAAVGLVKLDLLGNRALSSVAEAIRLVRDAGGDPINPETLPERDPATERLLASAETVGVCQLESPAMRHLLRQFRPTCLKDVMKVLALIRPGAASLGMKEAFIRRARGLDPIPGIDPSLDGILRESYGVMLFEDDALFVASALTGWSPEKADKFRRAVTKCRSDDERRELSQDFLGRCRRNGVDPCIAADLWGQMAKFNSYSFCRAHAASYARIAWANAWMKAHHLPQFWVGALNNNAGMYEKWVYVEEAKRAGMKILLPCVNRSMEEFALESGAIRVGLDRVRELTRDTRASIYRYRPFRGLFDLIARSEAGRCELENLIRAGALDFTRRARRRLLFDLDLCFEQAKSFRGRDSLFGLSDPPAKGARIREFSDVEKRRDEWDLLELFAFAHPGACVRPGLDRSGFITSRLIPKRIGKRVRVRGMVAATRTAATAKGGIVCFITLSDEGGVFELILRPEIYDRHKRALAESGGGMLWADGMVESKYDALSVDVHWIGALTGPESLILGQQSA